MKKLILTLALHLAATPAMALYSTLDTGDLLYEDQYSLGLEVQAITNSEAEGANLVGRFDMGYDEESNWQLELGLGEVDFQVAGYYKWVPFPDTVEQPAVGVRGGVLYASYEGENELSIRAHPFISKKFRSQIGELSPYASLPIGLRSYADDTELPINFAVGAKWLTNAYEKIEFLAEVGFDVNDSFSYITVGAKVQFDDDGLRLE
jgi:hypothetical protein